MEVVQSPNTPPMPSIPVLVFVGIVILSYGIGAVSLFKTLGCIFQRGITFELIRECMTPNIVTLLASLVIVGGMYYYIPMLHNVAVWILSLFITPSPHTSSIQTTEGFLVSPGKDPRAKKSVITRRELIDRLREHLYHRTTLPHGLSCSPVPNTSNSHPSSASSPHRSTPCSHRGPSRDAIYGYIQRILQQAPSHPTTTSLPEGWEGKVGKLMDLICEERCLLGGVIAKLEVDPQIQYTMTDVKLRTLPLLRFYNRARIGSSRYKSRREVNQIIGLPLGERDPINEISQVGVNKFRLNTSVHDTGDDPDKPTDGADVRAFLEHLGALPGDGSRPLATQTNELSELDSMAHHSLARGSTDDRGGNAPDTGFYHRMSSSYM